MSFIQLANPLPGKEIRKMSSPSNKTEKEELLRREAGHMDKENPEKFAFDAFVLAFRIQRLLESDLIPVEFKEGLTEDYARLREKVDLLTRFRLDREPAERLRGILEPFFRSFK
jgi:hypothetical protein